MLAIRYGASALGLVSEMPSGPGVIPESMIVEIAAAVPPGVSSFLLTSKRRADTIIAQQKRTGVNTLQLVDSVNLDVYERLRVELPGIALAQVIHVMNEQSIREAETVAPMVNALLLDSGNPTLAVKELGGTGRRHDWKLSKRIRENVGVPVFLAGGLRPENVSEAIDVVQPYGLDVCSGLRTNGALDEAKVSAFFSALHTHPLSTQ